MNDAAKLAFREAALMVAYNSIMHQAKHLMSQHRRLMMLAAAANMDADKLQTAIDEAKRIEEEIIAAAPSPAV